MVREESAAGSGDAHDRHESHLSRAVNASREPLPTRVDETPDLSAAYHAALASALTELDLDLEPRARAVIDGHVRLLLAWTPFINLTSIRDPAAVALAHVADSLTAVGLLRERGVDRFLDLGSGGGLPGLVAAAALPGTWWPLP